MKNFLTVKNILLTILTMGFYLIYYSIKNNNWKPLLTISGLFFIIILLGAIFGPSDKEIKNMNMQEFNSDKIVYMQKLFKDKQMTFRIFLNDKLEKYANEDIILDDYYIIREPQETYPGIDIIAKEKNSPFLLVQRGKTYNDTREFRLVAGISLNKNYDKIIIDTFNIDETTGR